MKDDTCIGCLMHPEDCTCGPPDCDNCGTAKYVVEVGPEVMGSSYHCKECKSYWTQET